MQLSEDKVRHYLGLADWDGGGPITDYAAEYGEPGYWFSFNATTPMFLLGDWWCCCPRDGVHRAAGMEWVMGRWDGDRYQPGWMRRWETSYELHDIQSHHPRFWAQLEQQGVEWAFYDEWVVDHENGSKAYRTEPDSYFWQSSIRYTDGGELLTPDTDIEDWIDWAVNNPERCLMSRYQPKLTEAGYTERECGFASGWYEGQNDDPDKITTAIRREHDDIDIVFLISDVGQFDVHFCVFTRSTTDTEEVS